MKTCRSNLDVSKAIGLYCGIEWGLKVNSFAPYQFSAIKGENNYTFSVYVVEADGSKIVCDFHIKNSLSKYIILVVHNKRGDNAILIENNESFKSIINDDFTINGKDIVSLIKRKFEAQIEDY